MRIGISIILIFMSYAALGQADMEADIAEKSEMILQEYNQKVIPNELVILYFHFIVLGSRNRRNRSKA